MGILFPVLTNPSIYKVPLLRDFYFMRHYFIIYKPYNVLSQFTSQLDKRTLSEFFTMPKNVYPVGRLDEDSEGLLILTDDPQLNHKLLNPSFAHSREYWVQVEGTFTKYAAELLEMGVEINVNGSMYKTKPCKIFLFDEEPSVALRNPPIRFRKNIPASWIKITLTEGKNRQVRKMCAKADFPVLRLIRTAIEDLNLGSLGPGEMIELPQKTVYKKLFYK